MRDNSPVKVTTVTLALTPEQGERLALAQTETRGKVILATRNLRDDRIVATAGVTKARLLGSEQPKKATSLQAQVSDGAERSVLKGETHTVSVVRAGQASEQTFVRDAGGLWAPVNTGEVRGAAMRAQRPAVACRVLLGLVFAAGYGR